MRKVVLAAVMVLTAGASYAAWLSVMGYTPARPRQTTDVRLSELASASSPARNAAAPNDTRVASPGSAATTTGPLADAGAPGPQPGMTVAGAQRVDAPFDASRSRSGSAGSRNFTGSSPRSINGGNNGTGSLVGTASFGGSGGAVGGGYVDRSNGSRVAGVSSVRTTQPRQRANGPNPAARNTSSRPSGSSSRSSGSSNGISAPSGPSAAGPGTALTTSPPVGGAAGVSDVPVGRPTDIFASGGSPSPSPTPEPTTMLLLGTGLAGLYKLRKHLQ